MDREVALKIFDSRTSQEKHTQLLAEARILGKVNHPNSVGVYSVGEYRNFTYISMTYAGADTLTNKIKNTGALSEARILSIAVQLINALSEAQDQGVIHGGIHPKNVLFTDEDTHSP